MISHLYGKICYVNKNYIILDINGIGYKLNIKGLNQEYNGTYKRFFIHTIIKNDLKNNLNVEYYAFNSPIEKSLFSDLLNISGIGVVIATNIIEYGYKTVIEFIVSEDIDSLKLIKGVNDKIARQIIANLYNQYQSINDVYSKSKNENNELIKALKNLGYSDNDINYAIRNMNSDLDIDEKIGQSIRLIAINNESKY